MLKKTKYMIFHNYQKRVNNDQIPKLIMKNKEIELVEDFNFLGIQIDKNLSWKKHIFNLSHKMSKAIGVMNRLKEFLPKKILKMIYNSLVNSHLNYGILLWGHQSESISKLQKKAIRIISKASY